MIHVSRPSSQTQHWQCTMEYVLTMGWRDKKDQSRCKDSLWSFFVIKLEKIRFKGQVRSKNKSLSNDRAWNVEKSSVYRFWIAVLVLDIFAVKVWNFWNMEAAMTGALEMKTRLIWRHRRSIRQMIIYNSGWFT